MKRLLPALLFLVPLASWGTILNSNGTASDTQAQINAASNGDTILLPPSGSYTWTTAVSMPASKFLTLDLNGSTITLGNPGGTFTINAHATGVNRVTDGTVIRTNTAHSQYVGTFSVADARGRAGVRVDHITFRDGGLGNYVLVEIGGRGPGVMDHCTFPNMVAAQEFIHITAWGPVDTFGWANDSGDTLAGSSQIFYIEDCTFTGTSTSLVSWIQGYYGCRIAIRHCHFTQASIDMHGTAGAIGARWWEVYNNTWTKNGSGWLGCNMRAGSGVIHGNSATPQGEIALLEEDSGWPADYQIGRGLNQTSDQACVWNNTNISTLPNQGDAPAQPNMVQLDRDYHNVARVNYVALTHPHPLQSLGGISCANLMAPTLRIIP